MKVLISKVAAITFTSSVDFIVTGATEWPDGRLLIDLDDEVVEKLTELHPFDASEAIMLLLKE